MIKINTKSVKNQIVRTRIPPSPTGFMHIGTARTALFNFLFARHNNGEFLFRIEDTDTKRSKPEFEQDIIESMEWLGLKWDGEILKQSQRKNIYSKYIKQLLDSGNAFWCYHTKEELEEEKQKQQERGELQVHFCEHHPPRETFSGNSRERFSGNSGNGIIRLKCQVDKKIKFHDFIRGEIEFNQNQIGDIVIAKNEQNPLYHFAVVIDDYESKITHVIRGEDHISNTPKQIMILEALGLPIPQYAHIALTLAPDKTKLSKRHGATSIREYREMGYLPEALINFMAFLGWNPGTEKEIFSLEQLIKEFSIERMQKSAAVFNIEKLNWFNAYYIRQKNIEELSKLCVPYLIQNNFIEPIWGQEQIVAGVMQPFEILKYKIVETGDNIDFNYLQKVIKLEQERMKNLSEISELTKFFFQEPEYDAMLLKWKNMTNQEIKNSLDKSYNILSEIKEQNFNEDELKSALMPEATKEGDRGRLLWPLRASITGLKASPGPFEILAVLGKEKALKRIKKAQNLE